MNGDEKKRVLEELGLLRADVNARLVAISRSLIEWTPKEYAVDMIIDPHSIVGEDGKARFGNPRVKFGDEVVTEQFVGIPETGERRITVKRNFIPEMFVVSDEDAPNFLIRGLFFGSRTVWGFSCPGVPATRFAESATPALKFDPETDACRDLVVVAGYDLIADVINTTAEPKRFRARFVGRELADFK